MARKIGQIVGRGPRTWLVRVYNGRNLETKKRNCLNQTIHGGLRGGMETCRNGTAHTPLSYLSRRQESVILHGEDRNSPGEGRWETRCPRCGP
jgi:hypothetical protein